jgi:hypothetical protein
VSYQPLLDLSITHLRNLGNIDPGEEVRVGLVTATDDRFLNDLGTLIREDIEFNGRSTEENEPDNFAAVATTSVNTDPFFDQEPVATKILELKPHIVISAADREMAESIIPIVEGYWADEAPGEPRPFYLLSPRQYETPSLVTAIVDQFEIAIFQPNVYRRIAGLNWPAAEDRTVYDEYAAQFLMTYPDVEGPVVWENFYDAAYYLIYAAAASSQPLSGRGIAQGMLRLLSGSQSYAVGRADMHAALTTLQSSAFSTFRLVGSAGPPNFDSAGGRTDPGSVWCINGLLEFLPDGMRYEAGSQKLVGTFPCWAFPALPPE